MPRDIDLVVSGSTLHEIKLDFRNKIEGENRFGGLSMRFGDWSVDVWPIDETWAFKKHWNCEATPDELPKTTFLNVEAVVMGLSPIPGQGRPVYENGFFDALHKRILTINFKKNPYPESCIVRTFITAAKLKYCIDIDLSYYIYNRTESIDIDDLINIQHNHYGRIYLDRRRLEKWIKQVRDHVNSDKESALLLDGIGTNMQTTILAGNQLNLWR
jgi:hypothetical protein